MDEHPLSDRLRRMGRSPVPPEVRDDHLHRMGGADTRPRRQKHFGRFAVAAAAIVGFMAGSTGLAMAGALPAPAQGVAHDVLSVVQVEVPDRPQNRGACISAAAKSDDEAAKQAAKAECPEGGVGRGGPPGHAGERGPKVDKHADDPCRGRPPWAGTKGGPTDEQKAAFEAQRTACPPDVEDQRGG